LKFTLFGSVKRRPRFSSHLACIHSTPSVDVRGMKFYKLGLATLIRLDLKTSFCQAQCAPRKLNFELELLNIALRGRFFVHEPFPALRAQKTYPFIAAATMSSANQKNHTSDQGGAGPSSRRSNQSKVSQKFGSRGRGGGRGKKRDMGRSEWRCVRDTFIWMAWLVN
jgi:hypothetical protein